MATLTRRRPTPAKEENVFGEWVEVVKPGRQAAKEASSLFHPWEPDLQAGPVPVPPRPPAHGDYSRPIWETPDGRFFDGPVWRMPDGAERKTPPPWDWWAKKYPGGWYGGWCRTTVLTAAGWRVVWDHLAEHPAPERVLTAVAGCKRLIDAAVAAGATPDEVTLAACAGVEAAVRSYLRIFSEKCKVSSHAVQHIRKAMQKLAEASAGRPRVVDPDRFIGLSRHAVRDDRAGVDDRLDAEDELIAYGRQLDAAKWGGRAAV